MISFFFFFFSSRRRHTRCSRDWSSDVCSSDLLAEVAVDPHDLAGGLHLRSEDRVHPGELYEREDRLLDGDVRELAVVVRDIRLERVAEDGARRDLRERQRSEERRVGKECTSRWSPYH